MRFIPNRRANFFIEIPEKTVKESVKTDSETKTETCGDSERVAEIKKSKKGN